MEYFVKSVFLYILGTGVKDWWHNGDKQIAFCRGGKGFIAFNNQYETDFKVTLQVNMTTKSTFGPLIMLPVS